MTGVAVVGAGYWGPNLVRNLAGIPDVELRAVCDLDPARAEAARRRFAPGARVVQDHRDVAGDSRIEAVAVATPLTTHFELTRDLLEAGKHVLVEKPLARSVAECQELIEIARRRERVLMVGHTFQFSPAVRWIRGFLERGELGRLLYIHSQRVNLGRIHNDASALWSFAPHDLSILAYWLERDPAQVSARGFGYITPDVADVVFVTLDYPDGVGVHLHHGWLDPRKVRLMTLVGSRRMLVYDDVSQDAKIQVYDKGVEGFDAIVDSPGSFAEFQFQLRVGDLVVPSLPFAEPLRVECEHFVDCVRSGRPPDSDGRTGLRVVRVLEAAERSLREGGRPQAP